MQYVVPKDTTASDVQTVPPPSSTSPVQILLDNPLLNSMWVYRPNSHPVALQADDGVQDQLKLRSGISLTRLAKTLYYDYEPYFKKAQFEPFETRSKPIRLVALRRNGRAPLERIRTVPNERDPVIAEMQSPFNEVGSFW
ncbi:uncharacterized protein LOC106133754 isoform X2 [Amyelois transitella]|uniref:uncharacterized protein LOC106133754 isoform X2 n=1 Tax=Amyelois transitella TaxID=680683 RepID=UPI00298F81BE|nr:uncharacterized protein LOC106133754 isoform X2 [Amyelois transitella]